MKNLTISELVAGGKIFPPDLILWQPAKSINIKQMRTPAQNISYRGVGLAAKPAKRHRPALPGDLLAQGA